MAAHRIATVEIGIQQPVPCYTLDMSSSTLNYLLCHLPVLATRDTPGILSTRTFLLLRISIAAMKSKQEHKQIYAHTRVIIYRSDQPIGTLSNSITPLVSNKNRVLFATNIPYNRSMTPCNVPTARI